MEKKQSSIDILMKSILESDVELYISMQESGEFEQIKAMHKEEIKDAYKEGNHSEMRGGKVIFEKMEDYYNETFGDTTTGVIVFDNIHLTNTSGTNHLSHINPLTDKLTNMEVTMSEQNSVVTLIQENESVIKVDKECERGCGNRVTKYDKFTEEEYCENRGWS